MATDVEREIRELLAERAGDVRPHADVPVRMLRRSRRRRVGTALGSTLVVAGLVAAAVVGTRALIAPTAAPQETRLGGRNAEPFAVWPQQTREDAEAAQRCADDMKPECLWQLNALEVARRYGEQELGWQDVFVFVEGFIEDYRKLPLGEDVGSALTDVVDPLSVVISECLPPHRGMCGMAELRVEKALRPDVTGIWVIAASRLIPAEGSTERVQEPSSARELPLTVELFTEHFMQARVAGRLAEEFLTDEARSQYAQGAGGLSLYGYTTPPGTTYRITGWDDQSTHERRTFSVVVSIEREGSGVATEMLELRAPPCPGDAICDFDYTISNAERIE